MYLALSALGDKARAEECQRQLRDHSTVPGLPGAVYAASEDGVTTGFVRSWGPWLYWRRPHAGGATCWYVFAESLWNPYWNVPIQTFR